MRRQEVWKECKFCGIRFGQDTSKCPKCGSSNAKLVMPKEMEADRIFFAEEKVRKEKEQAEKQAKKKKALRKWKKAFRVIGIVLAILLVLCIVGSFMIGHWETWMSQKGAEKWPEITETNEISGSKEDIRKEELSDEEWLEIVLPILDKWYAKNADEEILKIHEKALEENRPIYMWENYLYGAALYDFSFIEDIWEREQSGEILQDYENGDLLNYYLLYWDFEDSYTYTEEEKAWLQKYVSKLREDVEWRFSLTKEEWKALYADVTAEHGFVDYQKVKEYVENSDVWVASAIKATESMDDEAWKNKIFPILDELFEEGKDQELILIYYNTEQHYLAGERPFWNWHHNRYVEYMWELWDLEPLLQDVDAGKRLSELDYKTIAMTYFKYAYYEEEYYLSVEQKNHFAPYFDRLEECANTLWDFTQGEWKSLLINSKIMDVGDDVEWLIHKWLQETDLEKQTDEPEISE